MQQTTNCRNVHKERHLTLLNVQGHNWDDVEATALQVGTDAFPSGAKLTFYPNGDLKRCADGTARGHFGDDHKKFFLSSVTVQASWNEEEPQTTAMAQSHGLELPVVRGDDWESIKEAALREGAEAFPSAKAFTVQSTNGGTLKRCADWTRDHDFGKNPTGFFVEGMVVRSWNAVDK